MEKSYTKRFESFSKSLSNLESAKGQDISNLLVLSGTIMVFNLTFDIAWKLIKDILKEDYGVINYPSGSPKETLKKAESVDLINNDIWLDMLDDRNELTHDYDYNIANEKYNRIIDVYLPILLSFKNTVLNKIK